MTRKTTGSPDGKRAPADPAVIAARATKNAEPNDHGAEDYDVKKKAFFEARNALIDARATSIAGVSAKLNFALQETKPEEDDIEMALIRSAMIDAENLTLCPRTTTQVEALATAYHRAAAELNAQQGEIDQTAADTVYVLHMTLQREPSVTLRDLAIKIDAAARDVLEGTSDFTDALFAEIDSILSDANSTGVARYAST